MKIILKKKTSSGAITALTPSEPIVYRDQILLGSLGSSSGGMNQTAGGVTVPRGVFHTPSAVSAQTAQAGDSVQFEFTDYACASVEDEMMFVFKIPSSISSAGAVASVNSSANYPIVWSDSSLVRGVSQNAYLTCVFNSSLSGTVTLNGEPFTSLSGAFQCISASNNNPLTVDWQDIQNKPNFQTVQMNVTFQDQSTAVYNVCHIPTQS